MFVSALLGNLQLHDGGHHFPSHIGGFQHLSQPPPGRAQESIDFCGTFTGHRGRGEPFRRGFGEGEMRSKLVGSEVFLFRQLPRQRAG